MPEQIHRCPICKTVMVWDCPLEASVTVQNENGSTTLSQFTQDAEIRCPTCGYHDKPGDKLPMFPNNGK